LPSLCAAARTFRRVTAPAISATSTYRSTMSDELQRLVRSLSRRPLVYVRCRPQQAAHRPHPDGTRARCDRRSWPLGASLPMRKRIKSLLSFSCHDSSTRELLAGALGVAVFKKSHCLGSLVAFCFTCGGCAPIAVQPLPRSQPCLVAGSLMRLSRVTISTVSLRLSRR
jgi:hypothetical protein